MENPNLLSGLLRKRATLAGELEHAHSEVRRMVIDLEAVDQTIRIFQPDIDLETIRPKPLPPRQAAYKGEVSRIILGALRTAHSPMTADELSMQIMIERDMNTSDNRLRKLIVKRTHATLRHLANKGLLDRMPGPDNRVLWRTASDA